MPREAITAEQKRKEEESVKRFFKGDFTAYKSITESHSGKKVYKSSGELVRERNERLAILKNMHIIGKLDDKEFANMVVFVRRRYEDFVEEQTIRENKIKSYENPTNIEDITAVKNEIKNKLNIKDNDVLDKLMDKYGEEIITKISGKSDIEAEKIIKSEVNEIKDYVVEDIIQDINTEKMQQKEALEAIEEAIQIIGQPQTESQKAELQELKEDKIDLQESAEYNFMKKEPENQVWYDRLQLVHNEKIKKCEEIISDKTQDPEKIKLAEHNLNILKSVQIDRIGNMYKVDEHGNNVLKTEKDIQDEQNLVLQFFESEYDYKPLENVGDALNPNDKVYFENGEIRNDFANMKMLFDGMIDMYAKMLNNQPQLQNAKALINNKVSELVAEHEAENDGPEMDRKPIVNNSNNANE